MTEKVSCDKIQKVSIPRETRCRECGSIICLQFYNAREYAYKIPTDRGNAYFCNWNCMRKYQRARGLLPEQQGATKGDHFCKTYDEKNRTRRRKIVNR